MKTLISILIILFFISCGDSTSSSKDETPETVDLADYLDNIPTDTVVTSKSYSYTFEFKNTFTTENLTITVSEKPSWLNYDESTRTFSSSVLSVNEIGKHSVKLTASNGTVDASYSFDINVRQFGVRWESYLGEYSGSYTSVKHQYNVNESWGNGSLQFSYDGKTLPELTNGRTRYHRFHAYFLDGVSIPENDIRYEVQLKRADANNWHFQLAVGREVMKHAHELSLYNINGYTADIYFYSPSLGRSGMAFTRNLQIDMNTHTYIYTTETQESALQGAFYFDNNQAATGKRTLNETIDITEFYLQHFNQRNASFEDVKIYSDGILVYHESFTN